MTDGWRESPFIVGRQYRALKNFQALRDTFLVGETLTFVSSAYSRYDGMTGYFFSDDAGRVRAWDINDEADLESYRDLFAEFTPV